MRVMEANSKTELTKEAIIQHWEDPNVVEDVPLPLQQLERDDIHQLPEIAKSKWEDYLQLNRQLMNLKLLLRQKYELCQLMDQLPQQTTPEQVNKMWEELEPKNIPEKLQQCKESEQHFLELKQQLMKLVPMKMLKLTGVDQEIRTKGVEERTAEDQTLLPARKED